MGLDPNQLKLSKTVSFSEFKNRCISSQQKIKLDLEKFIDKEHFTLELMGDLLSKIIPIESYRIRRSIF